MGKIRVGTCSWTDPTLVGSGRFYPDSAHSAEDRLRYYASQFNLVEVDSSYYSLPSERTSELWVQRSGEAFTFDVKAFRLFTLHPTPQQALPKELTDKLGPELTEKPNLYYRDLPFPVIDDLWERFERALLPLDSSGKLGVVLFQFPPYVYPGSSALEHILLCKERLPQYQLAIEFRNSMWLSERHRADTFTFLRENGLAFVAVDEPQGFKSSVLPIAEATAEIGLVRFHGRNAGTWEKKGISAVERFNYLYNEDELKEWVDSMAQLSGQTRELHVLFNNCHEDKAVVNARQMSFLLRLHTPSGMERE